MQKLFSLLIALLALATDLRAADPTDPSDLFTKGYLACKKAEQLEADGSFGAALSSFKQAETALNSLTKQWPDWNPPMVKFRREKAAEGVARVKPRAGNAPGAGFAEEPLPRPSEEPIIPDSFPKAGGGRAMPPVSGGGDPIREIQTRIQSLQADLAQTREELAKSNEEKDDVIRRYDALSRETQKATDQLARVQSRADRAEDALVKAEADSARSTQMAKTLQTENATIRSQIKSLHVERQAEEELRSQMAERLISTRTRLDNVTKERDSARKEATQLPLQVASLNKDLEKANKERQEVQSRLSKTEEALKQAAAERDAAKKSAEEFPAKITILEKKITKGEEELRKVTAQRDEALAQVEKLKLTGKQVDKLLADNTTLMARLAEAEKTLVQLRSDAGQKDEQVSALKKEVANAQKELAEAQKQSSSAQKELVALQTKLGQQAQELAAAKADSTATAAERKRMAEENEALRNIVVREIKENARREQTKKLVLGELAQLELKSQTLLKNIELLGRPGVRLTESESKLFKKPIIEINDSEVSIAAPITEAKPDAPEKKMEAPQPTPPAASEKDPQPPTTPPAPEKSPEKSPEKLPDPAPPAPQNTGTEPKKSTTEMTKLETPAKPASAPASGTESGTSGASPTGQNDPSAPNVPPELLPLAREGKDQFDRGNYRDAEKTYEKILAKAPNNLYALSNLGVVRFRSGKLKLAEESFIKATKIAPTDAFSHTTLGIIYYGQNKYNEAYDSLAKAVGLQPKNPTAHNYLGITLSQMGRQDNAHKELQTAIDIDPSYADAYFNLAVVCATQQPADKESARKHYKRATELGAEPDAALEGLIK